VAPRLRAGTGVLLFAAGGGGGPTRLGGFGWPGLMLLRWCSAADSWGTLPGGNHLPLWWPRGEPGLKHRPLFNRGASRHCSPFPNHRGADINLGSMGGTTHGPTQQRRGGGGTPSPWAIRGGRGTGNHSRVPGFAQLSDPFARLKPGKSAKKLRLPAPTNPCGGGKTGEHSFKRTGGAGRGFAGVSPGPGGGGTNSGQAPQPDPGTYGSAGSKPRFPGPDDFPCPLGQGRPPKTVRPPPSPADFVRERGRGGKVGRWAPLSYFIQEEDLMRGAFDSEGEGGGPRPGDGGYRVPEVGGTKASSTYCCATPSHREGTGGPFEGSP